MPLKVLVGREFSAAMWKLGSICVQQQIAPQRSKQGRSLMFATGCILRRVTAAVRSASATKKDMPNLFG
ncbi:MAG: hypothetical protein ACKO81_01370, partial [Planctomycetota bacterium]